MNLEGRAARAAESAVCTRCGALMMQAIGAGRLTSGTYRVVGEKGTEHFSLCSECGPAFRLFLVGA